MAACTGMRAESLNGKMRDKLVDVEVSYAVKEALN
jgi:hypothetical protein